MKVSVFTKGVEQKEQEFFLKLEKTSGGVGLVLVDEHGEDIPAGNLLEIRPDMTIYRNQYVNNEIGLPLNSKRQLKMAGEDD